jgi:electron transport complex protein RnfD
MEATTTATPLAFIKTGAEGFDWSQTALLKDLFFGNVNGCIGEVSALALLVGAAYLLVRKVITWHIPVAFIGTVFLFALCKGGVPPLVHVLSGGVVIGACFMATDYVTSPTTAKGKLVFGIGCGLLTMLIRTAPSGSYPEGVSFSILIMNAFTPLINRFTQPKAFGKLKS